MRTPPLARIESQSYPTGKRQFEDDSGSASQRGGLEAFKMRVETEAKALHNVATRNVGLGPEHDWSSNSCDSFGYMSIAYEEPPANSRRIRRPPPPRIGTHWSD